MNNLFRLVFACIFCLTGLPAMAGDDRGDLTPSEYAAQHGITWPAPLPDATQRMDTLAALLADNRFELYKADGFDNAACDAYLADMQEGDLAIHPPLATAPDIPALRQAAGVDHCPQNNPLLNPGREWTILTKYYDAVTAIPHWRDWPTDKATLYAAQYNLTLYSPYPLNAAGQGPDLLFFGEGICRPADAYTCLSPRYKLFAPQNCDFHFNFMVDARYTPGNKKQFNVHNGVVDIDGNVFIYDFVADSAPDAPVRNGRLRLREIHDETGKTSKRSCLFGTPDYVKLWRRFH